jgi:hypothetical protein
MRDQFSAIDGIADLLEHLAAVYRFMAGIRMRRDGEVRQCQGTALADWVATMPDGVERARGTNVFTFSPDRRIASVTGFWRAPRTATQNAVPLCDRRSIGSPSRCGTRGEPRTGRENRPGRLQSPSPDEARCRASRQVAPRPPLDPSRMRGEAIGHAPLI